MCTSTVCAVKLGLLFFPHIYDKLFVTAASSGEQESRQRLPKCQQVSKYRLYFDELLQFIDVLLFRYDDDTSSASECC